MKVLVVGGGGREHALAWRLGADPGVGEVIAAPGNIGLRGRARTADVAASDIPGLADLAAAEEIDLTVVGPELPLDLGIVDRFRERGLRVLGPSRAAARLECSKAFAKAFMSRHGIPTARFRVCDDADQARAAVASGDLGFPVVVKADGLAAGKGVVIAPDRGAAERAIAAAMEARQFGEAGARVVLEECLAGPEVSFFALSDGRRAIPLGTAQDHKRVFDDDEGPNTGGMGAFSPSPLVDASLAQQIMREIVDPVIRGMRAEGHEYCGFLYAGLMLTCAGPRVIEFNVRLGDPEAQVILPAIAGELVPRLIEAADGRLTGDPVRLDSDARVGVVLASAGYPGPGPVGLPIEGLDRAASDALVFHSGTRHDPAAGRVVTAGGRVLTVVGRGATYSAAIERAYEAVSRISFDGMHYRRDIGRKALGAGGSIGPAR